MALRKGNIWLLIRSLVALPIFLFIAHTTPSLDGDDHKRFPIEELKSEDAKLTITDVVQTTNSQWHPPRI